MMALARQAGEVGQCIESEVHLARRAAILVALHLVAKIIAEMFRLDHLQESKIRVNTRRDNRREVLVALRGGDPDGLAVLHKDLRDRGLRLDLDSEFPRRTRYAVGDRSSAAASEAPRAKCAIDFA